MKRKSTLLISLVILSAIVWTNSVYGAAGNLLWEKEITVPTGYTRTGGSNIVVTPTLCVFYVNFHNLVNMNPVDNTVYVKAFNIKTGQLIWERIYNNATVSQNIPDVYGFKLTLDGTIVYYCNGSTGAFGAFNATNGAPLWDNISLNTFYFRLPSGSQTNINYIVTFSSYRVRVYQANDIAGTASPAVDSLLLDK